MQIVDDGCYHYGFFFHLEYPNPFSPAFTFSNFLCFGICELIRLSRALFHYIVRSQLCCANTLINAFFQFVTDFSFQCNSQITPWGHLHHFPPRFSFCWLANNAWLLPPGCSAVCVYVYVVLRQEQKEKKNVARNRKIEQKRDVKYRLFKKKSNSLFQPL